MPILEIKTLEHRQSANNKRSRLYKKCIAVCECDSCQIIFELKRFSKKQTFTFCSKECREKENRRGGKIDTLRKETYVQKYGHDNPLKIKEFRDKRNNTIKERYGVEHIQHSQLWKEKRRETIFKKYGDEFVRTEEFKEKRTRSLMERYGVTCPIQYKEFLEKRKITFFKRYGGHPLSNPDIYRKMFETNLKRYGYRTSFDLEETQAKCYYSIRGYSRDEYLENLHIYEKYRSEVRRITEKQNVSLLEGFEKRGKKGYHLDHIFSIAEGFRNNIAPEVIGDISNLRFLYCKENQMKSDKSDIDIEELYRRYDEQKL